MQVKLEMRKADNSATYEQIFEGNEVTQQILSKIDTFKSLFDFYSITIDNKKVINDKKTQEFENEVNV